LLVPPSSLFAYISRPSERRRRIRIRFTPIGGEEEERRTNTIPERWSVILRFIMRRRLGGVVRRRKVWR